MVLALVHPLLQVYNIPKTGQLAYVGHICNFRQKVSKFISSLPTLPQDMPFVQVRPRSLGSSPTFRAPFKVNVHKLRHAYEWLKHNNPYYHNIEWREEAAAQWDVENVQLPTRTEPEEDVDQALPVNSEAFASWMQNAAKSQACGEGGYAIGSRLLALLDEQQPEGNDYASLQNFRAPFSFFFWPGNTAKNGIFDNP
jgi:hypothetical protein